MTKPEDIAQWAWDTGTKMAGEYLSWLNAGNSTGNLSEHAVAAMADTIARAILAATEAEREACAQVAEEGVFDEHALAQATEYGRGAHAAAAEIAAAIRTRTHP